MSRFVQQTFAIKSRSHRKTEQILHSRLANHAKSIAETSRDETPVSSRLNDSNKSLLFALIRLMPFWLYRSCATELGPVLAKLVNFSAYCTSSLEHSTCHPCTQDLTSHWVWGSCALYQSLLYCLALLKSSWLKTTLPHFLT